MLEHIVVVGRRGTGPTNSYPQSGDHPIALVEETSGEVLYALKDLGSLLRRRIDGPVVVAGTVVGAAQDSPLLEVARVDRAAGPRNPKPPHEISRAGGPGNDGGR